MAQTRKRQFQPSTNQASITSFFACIDPINPPADFDPYDRKHVPSFSQPLPDPVQCQLMNMGMRIRKSVPEGYKTHKTMPAMSRMSRPPSSAPTNTKPALVHCDSAPSPSSAPLYSKSSELMPLCGLHKIGGFSSQPASSAPELSYSYTQSTIASTSSSSLSTSEDLPLAPSTPTNMRKRSYDDEIEGELDAIFDKEQEEEDNLDKLDLTVSPKSRYPFSHSSMPELNRKSGFVRPGSRPKARMKARAAPDKMMALNCDTAERDFDDEDAVFLQPMDCD